MVTSFEFDAWQHRQHVNICVETAQSRVNIPKVVADGPKDKLRQIPEKKEN